MNLWASWCQPCLQELAELRDWLAASHPDLRVVAISVDEVTARNTAQAALERLQWSAPMGYATTELINILETIQQSLLSRKQPLPIPTSFLIDGQGKLAVIYKGAVSVSQLEADLWAMDDDAAAIAARALPFPGWWHEYPSVVAHSQLAIARGFIESGDTQLGNAYLTGLTGGIDPAELDQDAEARSTIAGVQLNLAVAQFERGQTDAAVATLREALRYRPVYAKAHHDLALIYESLGQLDQARAEYENAVADDPDHVESHFNLGRILYNAGQVDQAMLHYQQAIRCDDQLADAYYNLGFALLGDAKAIRSPTHVPASDRFGTGAGGGPLSAGKCTSLAAGTGRGDGGFSRGDPSATRLCLRADEPGRCVDGPRPVR